MDHSRKKHIHTQWSDTEKRVTHHRSILPPAPYTSCRHRLWTTCTHVQCTTVTLGRLCVSSSNRNSVWHHAATSQQSRTDGTLHIVITLARALRAVCFDAAVPGITSPGMSHIIRGVSN